MARFYGEIQGNRGPATRMGSKASGFTAHIRGWDIGVRVYLEEGTDGRDLIRVYKTGGSNSPDTIGGPIAEVEEYQR